MEGIVKLIIGLINGNERKLVVDKLDVSEELGYLKAYKDDLQIGLFSFNQVCYWYVED